MQPVSPRTGTVHALLGRGRWREAHEAARALTRTRPAAAEPWHLLSLACQQLGQLAGAIGAAERALERDPGNASFALQCSLSLALGGRMRRAVALARSLEHAVEGSAAQLSKLGTVYSLCGEHGDAHRLFSTAATREPGRADHTFNRAIAARALGRLEEAEEACDAAIEAGLGDRRVYYVRSDLRRQSPDRNHLDELEGQLARSELPPMDAVYLAYALGKEQDDLGRWEDAFRSYSRAARGYRELTRYDPAADYAALEALVEHHTRDALDGLQAGDPRRRPIFVVGLPRSGTTLVERILQGDRSVEAVGERQDLSREIGARARAELAGSAADRQTLVRGSLAIDVPALAQAYWSEVGFDDARRPLDKMPINYLYLGLISRAFPGAKIVAMRRAPLDSCFSAWKAFLTGPYGFTYDLEELAGYYLRFDRLLRHWAQTLPAGQYQEVHYEDLVLDTEPAVRRLMDFLELPYDPALLAFHDAESGSATASAAQVRRPIYRDSVDRARHFAPWLAPLRERLEAGGVSALHPLTCGAG